MAQIAASIREFGWTVPILVDGDNGIVGGHARVLAARKLGLDTVPCIELAHLSEAQKRAYVIADNKLAENAGWDEDLLGVELGELHDLGFDLALTGFDEDELSDFLGETDKADVPQESDETTDAVIGADRKLLLIEFDSEDELRQAYEELQRRGWQCKIMD